MVSFKSKQIINECTLGEVLASRRNSYTISINQVERAIKISKDYLLWLEKGEYSLLPGEVYVKNFIKAYGSYLGLDIQELLELYKRERDVYSNTHYRRRHIIRRPIKFLTQLSFLSTPKIARNTIIAIAVFVFLLYLGIKVEAIMRPPELLVANPAQDILTDAKFLDVKGTTLPGSQVTINGEPVSVNEDGSFLEKINLSEGINEIRIHAKRDHSKENIVVRRVVVKEAEN